MGSIERAPWTDAPVVRALATIPSDVLGDLWVIEPDTPEPSRSLLGFRDPAATITPGSPVWAAVFRCPDHLPPGAALRVSALSFEANVQVGVRREDVPHLSETQRDRRRRGWG